ncbi:MAG TPA: fructosamine kinase family protein [Mariniphaga sp.]|nr:fructosamine kinase family protein [Mariniphaga sp.]
MKFLSSENLVENAVRKTLTSYFGRQVEIYLSGALGGGCISNASKIETSEGTFFLKWNADVPIDLFLREADGLKALKQAAGDHLLIPDVIAAKAVDEIPGFIVLEYLEAGSFSRNSDEILGRGLAHIHKFSNKQYGFDHSTYCGSTPQNNSWNNDWVTFYRDNRLRFLIELIREKRSLSAEENKIYLQLLDRLQQIISEDSTPALIHGDLWSGNYMATVKGPAIIDPACSFCDREMEFGIITMFGGFSNKFFNAYNEVYPLPVEWKDRNALYQLYHVLNHYYLFGGGYRNQALQIAKGYL